ncbi:sensor histidine kinase [Aquimarina rhabdastrellae]
MFFLEKAYPNCYETFLEKHGHLTYEERIFNLKAIFFHLPIFYLQPLFFLIALTFYERQYKISKTNEQRKMVELKALKQQLNPHFLFNTLNNLYALAVEKSDKAPEVIEKLSNILDYMLYGSDKKFVSIQKEVDLIENYLALEQVRYDDRVLVSFKNSITENLTIAPLLLLTFVENAFKHGVSQELKLATIKINLATEKENIIFNIFNTKPSTNIQKKSASKKTIGLINIEQQLELLYPNTHDLKIEETPESFSVQLKLKKQQDV